MPPVTAYVGEWIQQEGKPNADQHKRKVIEVSAGSLLNDYSQIFKNHSYGPKNYLGKNLLTWTHWRRYQRKKKATLEAGESNKMVKC